MQKEKKINMTTRTPTKETELPRRNSNKKRVDASKIDLETNISKRKVREPSTQRDSHLEEPSKPRTKGKSDRSPAPKRQHLEPPI